MGYADAPGFRAGIARPFYFYDAEEDIQTELRVVPFQVMDATLFKYNQKGSAESGEIILKLINETRSAGGLFVSIWHNTYLLNNLECHGYRELFGLILKEMN